LLPQNSNCAYEIVINALTEDELKAAMKAVIQAIKSDKSLLRITSTNYEGKLGEIKIHLKDLI
jgi:formylmethanofuran:tetrahydromethanopterin formyltransferase